MRDIAVTLLVFGSIPFILSRPWFGIIVWTWLGFMNPHRMAWGFSTTMPFAFIIAITTIFAYAVSKEPKRIPWMRESIVLLIFILWMCFTTIFAYFPDLAQEQLIKVLKIELMIFVGMMLINTKQKLNWLVLTIALSIGFYGVKGGIFTIVHGGVYRVQGPPGTFIDGNNELGLALAMTVPLFWYATRQSFHKAFRPALFAGMVLTCIAAIGTQSRGALLGMGVTGIMFWLKAKQKLAIAVMAILATVAVFVIMPPEWWSRMDTIENYEQDASAQGRLNAWGMAWNMAKARPIVGGGFSSFQWQSFQWFAPNPDEWRDVHSIYFQVLGHHGFPGFALFILLGLLTWMSAGRLRRETRDIPDMHWLGELGAMVQVSLAAYATAGAFLGLAYFDYFYNLVLIVVVGKVLLEKHKKGIVDKHENLLPERQRGTVAPPTQRIAIVSVFGSMT